MREFVFSLEYDPGNDDLLDLLGNYPEARSVGFCCALSTDKLWRVDRVSGPTEVVDRARSVLVDDAYDGLSVSSRPCEGEHYRDVLEDNARDCSVYTYVDNINRCDAIETMASRYIDAGVLFEVRRRARTERWRVMMQDDEKVGLLYDTIGGRLRDGVEFSFGHLEDVADAPLDPFASFSLQPEQRRVLDVAEERGYYQTPRETTLDESAEARDVPRSTVSYRLRRAEADLVEEFLSTK
jgi:predicted DNA binding protein